MGPPMFYPFDTHTNASMVVHDSGPPNKDGTPSTIFMPMKSPVDARNNKPIEPFPKVPFQVPKILFPNDCLNMVSEST